MVVGDAGGSTPECAGGPAGGSSAPGPNGAEDVDDDDDGITIHVPVDEQNIGQKDFL